MITFVIRIGGSQHCFGGTRRAEGRWNTYFGMISASNRTSKYKGRCRCNDCSLKALDPFVADGRCSCKWISNGKGMKSERSVFVDDVHRVQSCILDGARRLFVSLSGRRLVDVLFRRGCWFTPARRSWTATLAITVQEKYFLYLPLNIIHLFLFCFGFFFFHKRYSVTDEGNLGSLSWCFVDVRYVGSLVVYVHF